MLSTKIKNLRLMKLPIPLTIIIGSAVPTSDQHHLFHGDIFDFNLYTSKEFLEADFVYELACLGNPQVNRLLSMKDIVQAVKGQPSNMNLMSARNESTMLCHQPCEKTSTGSFGKRDCSVKDLNLRNCHKYCHRIPFSLNTINLCLNCVVYFVGCPILEHLKEHIIIDELPYTANSLKNDIMYNDVALVLEAIYEQKQLLKSLNNGLYTNVSCETFLTDALPLIHQVLLLGGKPCSGFEDKNVRACKKDMYSCKKCMDDINYFQTIGIHIARQVLKCNNYEKINRRVNKLTNVSHHNVIAYFSKKKNRVLAGKTKFGTWLLDAHCSWFW